MRLSFLLFPLLAAGQVTFTTEPSVEGSPNPRAPLAAVLRFATAKPVEAQVTVKGGARPIGFRFGAKGQDPARGLGLAGFRPGRTHTVDIAVWDPRRPGAKTTRSLTYTAPPLSAEPNEIPPVRVQIPLADRVEPGFTLMSVRRQAPGQLTDPGSTRYGMLLALDAEGEVVWYYRSDSRISDFERTRRGTILLCTLDYEILEIDLLGKVLNRWYAAGRPQGKGEGIAVDTMTFHHEVDDLPNGDIAVLGTSMRELDNYYTSETDRNAPRKRQKVMGDQVVVFSRDGKVVWKWDAFDHMDPMRIGYETFSGYWERRGFPEVLDWSHANNLLYNDRDDSFLVSFRYQSAIVKISRKTGRMEWVLGRPEGWSGTAAQRLFTLAPGGRWFHHQHAPFPSARGTVFVFDNGNYRTVPFDKPLPPAQTYSRAVEYRLDEKTRTATELWQSEDGPNEDSVVSVAMGNAEQMMRTGNVLVSYGALLRRPFPEAWNSGGGAWSRVREYTHDKPARLVWEAVVQNQDRSRPMGWQIFTATRWPDFPLR